MKRVVPFGSIQLLLYYLSNILVMYRFLAFLLCLQSIDCNVNDEGLVSLKVHLNTS